MEEKVVRFWFKICRQNWNASNYKNKMGLRVIINKIIKWFLNEDKDKEYIIWCIKHGYTEDIKNLQ